MSSKTVLQSDVKRVTAEGHLHLTFWRIWSCAMSLQWALLSLIDKHQPSATVPCRNQLFCNA